MWARNLAREVRTVGGLCGRKDGKKKVWTAKGMASKGLRTFFFDLQVEFFLKFRLGKIQGVVCHALFLQAV